MGYILLQGGAEFDGEMRGSDLQAIALAGGAEAPIYILPTAAAPDANHARAGRNGTEWFTALGAKNAQVAPVIDSASANDPGITTSLQNAGLVYLLGGFTHYLAQTLENSLAWQACLQAHANGAVIAGSSAGAMVLCEYYFDPNTGRIEQGLNLVPNCIVLPHHNTFGKRWAARIQQQMPSIILIGIDEQTGMLNSGPDNSWIVLGRGKVTIYNQQKTTTYGNNQEIPYL